MAQGVSGTLSEVLLWSGGWDPGCSVGTQGSSALLSFVSLWGLVFALLLSPGPNAEPTTCKADYLTDEQITLSCPQAARRPLSMASL